MRWQETARGGTIYYPIWLAYATALLEESHQTKLVDAVAKGLTPAQVVEDVANFDPDIVVVDSSYTSWRNDLEVTGLIKQMVADLTTVVVGPPTTMYAQSYMEHVGVDAVIQGEYDYSLREFADSWSEHRPIEDIAGLWWKEGAKIRSNPPRDLTTSTDLDELPWVSPVYKKHLNIKDYFLSSALYPEVQIVAERGCPYRCTFCEWPQVFTKRKYRSRSVRNVVDEMKWIKKNLPEVKEIVFEDDTFTVNRNWIHEFCEKLIEEQLNVTWSAQIRADVDYGTLRDMRKAGCRLAIVGFESGSDKLLNTMKKGLTTEQSLRFSRAAKDAGILIHGDFVIGMPGETEATITETWNLIKKIRPEILQVSLATPFPGTEFYDLVKSNGYLMIDDPVGYLDGLGHQLPVISYPSLDAAQMQEAVNSILKRYYLSASYVPLALRQIIRKNGVDELRRLLKSARVFLQYVDRKNPRERLRKHGLVFRESSAEQAI
jgi:radical SAM superfamily enzyme YgiQ (UPF0313 family)